MEIVKKAEGDSLFIFVKGRMDTVTAPQLEKEAMQSVADCKMLVLDFKELEYVSSAGLRVILMLQKVMSKQGSMKVVNVNEEVYDVLEITGFADILTIER